MSNLNDKATKAVSRYLEHRGYTVLETAWKCPAGTCDVIAEDGDAIVFVDVSARRDADKGFPTERCSAGVRERWEMVALAWFAEHEDAVDMAVRFDNIAMLVMGDSRAMIRHYLNALGGAAEELQPRAAAGIPTGPTFRPSRRPLRPPGLHRERRALRPSGRRAFFELARKTMDSTRQALGELD